MFHPLRQTCAFFPLVLFTSILLRLIQPAGAQEAPQEDPPLSIQMLLPGYEAIELPIRLPNLNNLRYRPDGAVYALGYSGDVWLLRDTNGDGLEDSHQLFFENKASLRGPIGMAVAPAGHALLKKDGQVQPQAHCLVVASKGKVSALIDWDGDNAADEERVIASGWQEIAPNVDTIGVAFDPRDGAIYFGLGTAAFDNAYLLDEKGKAGYDLTTDRGTVQRISPDLSSRQTICSGVRFTIAFAFNEWGDLFATDQEGATWMPNGNPFDEFLQIKPNRHYGFPPRHPKHLPKVFDEPSLVDFAPQHQSTCGFFFNVPEFGATKTFGPDVYKGNAFVTGESRGKIYRVALHRREDGEYLAASTVFASLSMLTVDCTLRPDGGMLVCCHSGGPDWGTGPSGIGKIFLLRQQAGNWARPITAWSSGSNEASVLFDRPLGIEEAANLQGKLNLTAGPYVSAGDRLEVLRPGYEVVRLQQEAHRREVAIHGVNVSQDRRTLLLATDPLTLAESYALTLPTFGKGAAQHPNTLPQKPEVDLDFTLNGVAAEWRPRMSEGTQNETQGWTNVWQTLDPATALAMRENEPLLVTQIASLAAAGTLNLNAVLDTKGLFLPVTQPGSKLDYNPTDDQWIKRRAIRITSTSSHKLTVAWNGRGIAQQHNPKSKSVMELELSGENPNELWPLELQIETNGAPPRLLVDWVADFADGSQLSGPLPHGRLLAPWAQREEPTQSTVKPRNIPELADASWGRGRKVFLSDEAACSRCHKAHGVGGDIGPDLSNLIHRDYASVRRDIAQPSFAINPDFVTYTVTTHDGQVLTGPMRNEGNRIRIADAQGKTTEVDRSHIETIQPAPVSVMPDGLVHKLGEERLRDLLSFLLLPGPQMPRDCPEVRPTLRKRSQVANMLAGGAAINEASSPMKVLLVAGAQDHGPGEHDYPAWLKVWRELMLASPVCKVDTAMDEPSDEQWKWADVVVYYQRGAWNHVREAAMDRFLAQGKGLVFIHWAVEGGEGAEQFAQRIGWASNSMQTKYRHGPLSVDFTSGEKHPIARNFSKLELVDESYWNLRGDGAHGRVIAVGGKEEEGVIPSLFWTVEPSPGRVFVSIPGHYSWTFDDPLYRVLLLRGIAWAAGRNIDMLNDLVPLGVEFAPE